VVDHPGKALTALLVLLLGGTTACGSVTEPSGASGPSGPLRAEAVATSASAKAPQVHSVLAISIDGLNVKALRRLGTRGAPNLFALVREGASTFNARTEREQTVTLPNHTGMVTGRRIARDHGGHGVTWNDERDEPSTVQEAAGEQVRSVFSVVHTEGRGRSAVFAGKGKFALWKRSWPTGITRQRIDSDMGDLVRTAKRDLRRRRRELRFLHLAGPDIVGHRHGFLGRAYYDSLRRVDRLVGSVLRTARRTPRLRGHLAVIVTADHGATRSGHSQARLLANHRVPFIVRGPGVARGADLYDLNRDYANPGRRRPPYSHRRQPVRNGDLANVALDLLGLPPVPGSEHDSRQDLDLR
jgi:predicted AlkP superfamily pyrophosphatase or phosphodiesterase